MKRISKKRLGQIREWAKHVGETPCDVVEEPRGSELLALLDAYERRPDEVADGWAPAPFIDWDDAPGIMGEAQLMLSLTTRMKVMAEDEHVRIEIYRLDKKGGARGEVEPPAQEQPEPRPSEVIGGARPRDCDEYGPARQTTCNIEGTEPGDLGCEAALVEEMGRREARPERADLAEKQEARRGK